MQGENGQRKTPSPEELERYAGNRVRVSRDAHAERPEQVFEPDEPGVDMDKLENEMNRNLLDEIAELTRKLTYGQMMKYAEQVVDLIPYSEAQAELKATMADKLLPQAFHKWSSAKSEKS